VRETETQPSFDSISCNEAERIRLPLDTHKQHTGLSKKTGKQPELHGVNPIPALDSGWRYQPYGFVASTSVKGGAFLSEDDS
jgi:hypothetical protein